MSHLDAARLVPALALVLAASCFPAISGETAWLGVHVRMGDDGGVEVVRVVADSPAAAAGLRARDVIVAVDGSPIVRPEELIRSVVERGTGAWVPLTVRRKGEDIDIRATLAERPADAELAPIREGTIGAAAIDLPPALREHFGAPPSRGAMVYDVQTGSSAEAAGLRIGDVVFEIDGVPVRFAQQLAAQVSEAGVGNVVELAVARDGATLTLEAVVVDLPQPVVEAPAGELVEPGTKDGR
jgi:serine protease Do